MMDTDTNANTSTPRPLPTVAEWKEIVARFQEPSVPMSVWQIVNTIGAYALLWYFMWLSLPITWWLTVPLAILAGGLVVRVFIIFHDCGHGSFFKSRLANDILGYVCGILTFTPYYHWRWEHALHHASSGDLDRRGFGDIWTLTVKEYLEASWSKRFFYRLSRNPFVLFCLAPLGLFFFYQRFASSKANKRERYCVYAMNAALLVKAVLLSLAFGVVNYLIIQTIVMLVAGAAGVWMFYVQHQFEETYWERREDWDFTAAALHGSSFYKLPRILQWFTGNIGFHHIHHLSSRIPNYNLERCHNSHPIFTQVKPITLLSSLRTINLRLWDEELRKLVSFRRIREIRAQQQTTMGHPAA
ncbi:MAG: fatty acid desaturase [Roseimicrobium sp.]